jgi:hypothetical protein
MKNSLIFLLTVLFMGCIAFGQTDDLGAHIAAADAALGARPGDIQLTTSGTISEGKVSISAGHNLVCKKGTKIFLKAGSYIYQNSYTSIKNCIIEATSTPILGEVQSTNTDHVELNSVTFVGGGNLVYWNNVNDFRISDNKVVSITAVDPATHTTTAGYYLVNCSRGEVDNLRASGFAFPAGSNQSGVLELNLSSNVTVNNPMISDVDASYILSGAGAIVITGSTNIAVNGGVITGNANMDGILSESYQNNVPSSRVSITGVDSSYNGTQGRNVHAPLGLGDGLDIINTRHVSISHCILDGNGSLHDEQPGIWLFLDDDVLVADSDISDSSMAGIAAAGSRHVRLIRDSINRNQASGVYTEFQGGTATNVGPAVTFFAGVSGGFSVAWEPGTPFTLDGVNYPIASVTDSTHLTLATSPADHSSPVAWSVETTQYIRDTVIDDNGLAKFGGQSQVGISWADGTSGIISGVTATDTGAGTQLYGLELANTATATLYNDNFSGNVDGGINASSQSVSPPSLSFPNQPIGTTSSPQTVTLTAGAIVVQNLVIQISGDFAQTNNCGTGLAAFATCQIQVTFTPTVAGTRNGTLTINDGAPSSPQTVSLTGIGVSAQSVSPANLSFSNQRVASISPPQTVTLTAGAVAIQNLIIQVSGSFSQTSNCGTGLAASATCQVKVTFTPMTTGTLNSTLTLSDSAPDSPQTVSLTGSGVSYGLGLRVAAGASDSVTVAAGSTARYSLSLGGAGISGIVSVTCTGAPTGTTCNVPATVPLSATQITPLHVNVTTTASSMGTLRPTGFPTSPWLWAVGMLGCVILPAGVSTKRSSRRHLTWLPLVLLLMSLCSCGGSGEGKLNGTPAGTYNLTIMATVGSTREQMPLALTVQ